MIEQQEQWEVHVVGQVEAFGTLCVWFSDKHVAQENADNLTRMSKHGDKWEVRPKQPEGEKP